MTKTFTDLMRDARSLVAGRRLDEATAAIQEALGGKPARPGAAEPKNGPTLDLQAGKRSSFASQAGAVPATLAAKLAPLLGARPRFQMPGAHPATPDVPVPEGARFGTHSYVGPAGSRTYKLYVPASRPAGPRPLIVMLHGCTQDPDDFARGTRMNTLAEEGGFLVAYPEQPQSANARLCWNWFEPAHQRRASGEPAILAGIVAEIASGEEVDARAVFVAGLSAGGAMAAVMGATYPELFAGIGVHSGLPFGAASDVSSALSVMRSGRGGVVPAASGSTPRLIVFHGDGDRTVHPTNGDALAGAARPDDAVERGSEGGRSYTRLRRRTGGKAAVEYWSVEGLGHAWSGGDDGGTYADSAGPDASRAMVRFFFGGAGRS